MNNAVFGKAMNNMRKHRDTKLVTIEARRNFFTTCFCSSKNLLVIEIKRTQIFMDKLVFLGLLILEMCKIVMHEFWNDYIKPKF